MKKSIYCLLILLFIMNTEEVYAQFEGQFVFKAYEPDRPENPEQYVNLLVTHDRLFLKSEDQYNVLTGVQANGFLIRHDKSDFLFMTGENEAVRITTQDINSLTNMLNRMQGASSEQPGQFDWEKVKETDNSRNIHGYHTRELRVYEENENAWISVWLTDQIKINWGILEETWGQSSSMIADADLPVEVFMNRNSFPLLIEYYKNDRLNTVVEAIDVKEQRVHNSQVDVPEGTKLLGLTDLMMRMMMR